MAAAFDPDRHMETMAASLGLEITPEQAPGARQFLEIAAGMYALLEAAPVPADSLELASVYTPPEQDA